MKWILHLHSYGRDWYLTKQKKKLPSTATRIGHVTARANIQFARDKRMAIKFSTPEAAMRHWGRLLKLTGIKGWTVLPVQYFPAKRSNKK